MTVFLLILLSQATPDPALTPGATDPAVNQSNIATTICIPGYTAKVRHVTEATKKQVIALYRAAHPNWPEGPYEIDHLVSLELAGTNDIGNLWPEPYCPLPHDGKCLGAREKDVVETTLHRMTCKGLITLEEAQKRIVNDWVEEYRAIEASR